MGWATLLRTGGLSAEQHDKAVRTVERSIRHQVQLVDDLLDVSRILAGKLRLELTSVDLVLVMEQLRDEVQVAARAKGIELVVAMDDCGTIVGDVQRVAQIFRNLLTNAIKFTQAGGRITISCVAQDDRVMVTVSDTGQGIAAEFLPHIFDRFSQEDSSMTRQHGGLGLGLGIVKHLVELHGGAIEAHSDGLGRGATFRVFLAQGVAGSALQAGSDLTGAAKDDALRGVRVGLVDDDATARDALAALLQQSGARVVSAGSAREALDLFAAVRLVVVVTDLGMPEHDGFWLARELHEASATTPLIALSGFAGSDVKARVRAAGFAAHVAKPAGRGELEAAIAGALAVGKKARESSR
jgi:CheY-like chemotaxis protein/two-component sensor histidine kinase